MDAIFTYVQNDSIWMNPSPSASDVQAFHGCQWELGWRKPEGIGLLLENGEEGAFYEKWDHYNASH